MSVVINLKEIFSTDSQIDVSSKVNFNFNQLIALGFGQIGLTGDPGIQGPPGPIGPDGIQGPIGTVIFGDTPSSTTAPTSPPIGMVTGDLLITSDSIIRKIGSGTGWEKLTDFNSLVVSALGSNASPFVKLTGNSRIIKPRITSGLDLTNASSPAPNYQTPGLGTNNQTVLYNFNELNTSSVIINGSGNIVISSNGSSTVPFDSTSGGINLTTNVITGLSVSGHGLVNKQYVTYSAGTGTVIGGLSNYSGYYVLYIDAYTFKLCDTELDVDNNNPKDLTSYGTGNQTILTYPSTAEQIFPATANLSLYSVFGSAATQAKEFASTAKGYRHQLELGSVDALPTAYSGIASVNYVISPSFENLKVKKYRVGSYSGSADYPGTYYLRAEYDLSSAGGTSAESFSPRRNSEQIWKINKISTTQASGQTFELKLTNSNLLAVNESGSGVSIDGLLLKRGVLDGGGGSGYIGFGFDPSDATKAKFDASSGITKFSFDGVSIELKNGSDLVTLNIDADTYDAPTFVITSPINMITNVNGLAETNSTLLSETVISNKTETIGGTKTVVINGVSVTLAKSSTTLIETIATGFNYTINTVNGNIQLTSTNSGKFIALNNAIKVQADRLAQGIPFPTTQVPSADVNTLDDYEEGAWGGAGNSDLLFVKRTWSTTSGLFSTSSTGWLDVTSVNISGTSSAIDTKYNQYTKIGNLVTFTVNYIINIEYIYLATGEAPNYSFESGGSTSTYTDDSFEGQLGIRLPFAPKANSPINARGIALGDSSAFGNIEIAQVGDAENSSTWIAALSTLDADGLSSALVPYTPGSAISIGLSGSPSTTIKLQLAVTISYFAAD
jgi:hypothetical protein